MQSWLATRRATLVAIALSLLLAAPSLGLGFVTDDQGFRAVLRAHARPAWDLFGFQRGDAGENLLAIRTGHLPWWAAPDLRIHFVRPLSSLLFAVDDRLFADAAWLYHLHSLLWLALLLVGAASFFRRIAPPVTASLAVLLFGVAAAHTEAFSWLSARHALLGAAGAAWALALYARDRGTPRWTALVPLLLGLAASESALGGLPILCAVVLSRETSLGARLRACAPWIAIGVAYLVVYRMLGGGARGSGGYHDPFSDPLGFVALAWVRLPILLGDATLAIPSELAFAVSSLVLALAGMVATALAIAAFRATRPHPEGLGWLCLGGLVALLPGVAAFPTGRVLLVPDLAFAVVLASILTRALQGGALSRGLAVVLALGRLVLSPLLELHDERSLARRGRYVERIARETSNLVPHGGRAILVTAADPFVFLYPRGVLAETSPGAVSCWSVLSAARGRHRITRTAGRAIEITMLDHPLLDGHFDSLFRSPDRSFAVGDTVSQCGGTVRVEELDGGRPRRITISFQRALDDPELTFLVPRDKHIVALELPKLGESLDLPPTELF